MNETAPDAAHLPCIPVIELLTWFEDECADVAAYRDELLAALERRPDKVDSMAAVRGSGIVDGRRLTLGAFAAFLRNRSIGEEYERLTSYIE